MRVFWVALSCVLLLAGLAATTMPVEATIGLPATLTPFPTFAPGSYDSPAQATLAREMTNTIWWEGAPHIDNPPNPRPGFVLYIIQWWNWINDNTHQAITYSILLLVVIFLTLRFAHRMKTWGEKADGASVGKNEVTMKVEQADVDKFMAGR